MSVRITGMEGKTALFDSTSGIAFGPVFDLVEEAEGFLSWVEFNAKEGKHFTFGHEDLLFLEDVRTYRPSELKTLFYLWQQDVKRVEASQG